MRNFKIWSGLVLIFVSGAVVGSIVSALLIKQRVEGFPKRGPHMANRMIVYEIIRDMELSPALRDSIDAILEADRLEVEKLGAEFGRSLEEFTGRQFEKIKVVLSDDQKEIFDERAAELARLGGVSRARITQIMDLLRRAPDIQEEILFLPKTGRNRDAFSTAALQPLAREHDWQRQRVLWARLKAKLPASALVPDASEEVPA